jgi:hypothetical protein
MIFYASRNLKVFADNAGPTFSEMLVVCFQYQLPDPSLDAPGFGEEFFRAHRIDSVFVNCATNEWWQYRDLPRALSILRGLAASWRRTVTYGSSMGGYAALRFAGAIGATTCIAVGPQYSPRGVVVPGEDRYDSLVSATDFLHEDAYRICRTATNFVLYDPLYRMDKRHVLRYAQEANLLHVRVPCTGHTPTVVLSQCGLLGDVILELLSGIFLPAEFRRSFRRARRASSEYWRELALRSGERKHAGALPSAGADAAHRGTSRP